ncbi:MAG: hypothetical protein JNL57_01390 [Bacteroidetes bacterium]|nr:hypothetical protein [Bacteroidota bacterium]
MKTQHLFLAAAVLGLAITGACKKKTTTTPTPKPTNVLMCKANGVAWQSGPSTTQYNLGGSSYKGTECTLNTDTLHMQGIRISPDTSAIVLHIKLTGAKTGTYTGTTDAAWGCMYAKGVDLGSLLAALFSYTTTYTVEITKVDMIGRKISGTFIIAMQDKTGSQNINVTEGEFIDLKF